MRSLSGDVDDTADEMEMVLGVFGPYVLLVAFAYALGRWVFGLHDEVAIVVGLAPAYVIAKAVTLGFRHLARRAGAHHDAHPARG